MQRNIVGLPLYPILIGGFLIFTGVALAAFRGNGNNGLSQQQQLEAQRERAAEAQQRAMYGLLVPIGMAAVPLTAVLGMFFLFRKTKRERLLK